MHGIIILLILVVIWSNRSRSITITSVYIFSSRSTFRCKCIICTRSNWFRRHEQTLCRTPSACVHVCDSCWRNNCCGQRSSHRTCLPDYLCVLYHSECVLVSAV